MFLTAIYSFSKLSFAWWWFALLLLTPDVSMMGYVFVNNAGAVAYNIFHHKAVALAIYGLGAYQQNENTETRGNYFIRSLVNGQDIWIWVENIQRV